MYTYYSYNKSKIKAFLLRKEYLPFWGRINIIFRIFATLYFYGYVFKQSIIGLSSDYPISWSWQKAYCYFKKMNARIHFLN